MPPTVPTLDLWSSRRAAQEELDSGLQAERDTVLDAFEILDAIVREFEALGATSDVARAYALSIVKARNFGHGVYSLIMDGLAQEAGALVRPLVEACELVRYLQLDPSRAEQVLTDSLPSAGKIAQEIQGILGPVRTYLNESASHLSFNQYSVRHLFDPISGTLRTQQPHISDSFSGNIRMLFAIVNTLGLEAVISLRHLSGPEAERLANRGFSNKERGDIVFGLQSAPDRDQR
jgi:hypothetical protein